MPHADRQAIEPQAVFDFRKPVLSEWAGSLPSDHLRRNVRDVRESRGLTQRQLAEQMTAAGRPMTHSVISKIESGKQSVTVDELVVFAAVLMQPAVRLMSPPEALLGELAGDVRVTNWRWMRAVEFRNWLIYGEGSTRAARAAQQGMRFAHAAYALADPRNGQQRKLAKERISELVAEIKRSS